MSNVPPTLEPEHWVERHADALYAYALMRVGSAAVAEDLVQDAMLAGLGSLERFRGDASERTWLIGILKHKVLDHLRRRGREVGFDDSALDTAELDAPFDESGHWKAQLLGWSEPGRQLENAQLGSALAGCIEALPERLQTLFVLREIDGLGTDELVATLNISSRNNLWVMLSRARERLRRCLERQWSGEA